MESFNHHLEYTIPFASNSHAEIARKTLSPDPVLKPTDLEIVYTTEGDNLIMKFHGVSEKAVRVSANNILENLKTIVECLETF